MTQAKYGPKMLALPNDRWRRFVIEWLESSEGRASGAARRAGFKGNPTTIHKTAYCLSHDSRIQEAIQEEARKRLNAAIPMSLAALEEIVREKTHKDRLAAVKTVLDRTGLHETRQVEHRHEFIANDPIMIERVRQISLRLGIPVERLIGHSAFAALPAQEAEFKEIENATHGTDTDEGGTGEA